MSVSHTRSSSKLSAIERLVLLVSCHCALALAASPREVRIHAPCTDAESWQLAGPLARSVPAESQSAFFLFLTRKDPPFRGFAEASGLKKESRDELASAFADYWLGRSLYAIQLYGFAADHFNNLVAQWPTPNKLPIQIAAMACLERIHRADSTLGFSDSSFARIPAFARVGLVPAPYLPIVWEGIAQRVLYLMQKDAPKEAIRQSLALLKGAGYLDGFVGALWDVQRGAAGDAVPRLVRLVEASNLPPSIGSRRNELRVLLARLYYQTGNYTAAIRQLELVDKQSNELVQALSHLASAQLMSGNYEKAIGAAVSLSSGGLRETFAPEGLMVTAMALNELCQYPESLRALNEFKKSYQSSYLWLRAHVGKGPQSKERLYPLAIAFLKGTQNDVPARIGSEWVRSPVFITRQEAINLTFRTLKRNPELNEEASHAREADASDLAKRRVELIRKIREAKRKMKAGQSLPNELKAQISAFKETETRQRHLTQILPEWAALLARAREAARQRQIEIIASIESELRELDQRMYQELSFVLENNELIDAEIWNGASQDIVWQNAHPEYREMVKSGKLTSDRGPASSAADVYDWGTATSDLNGTKEVWEDELGSIQASLQNNCANKEKYLKLQQRHK